MSFESFPFNIGWELTLACNLRCSHCGSSAGLPKPNELTKEEALKICDQFPELLVQQVHFTGGEALLSPYWAEIALYLKNLGISTNILTNGYNLKPETVSKIKSVGISAVGISLDGLEKTHDYIRGQEGSFKKVLTSINFLQQKDINIIVITTVNSLNVGELLDILHLLQSIGIRNWRVQPLIPTGRANNSKKIHLDDMGILKLGKFIQHWKPKSEMEGTNIICGDGLEYIFGTSDPERPWRGCPAGWITCSITSDGKVKGCLSLPDKFIEGDLRKNDLWSIWFNPNSFAYTRLFSYGDLGSNCNSCDKATECLGGCSSNSYSASGKFHNDPYCFYKINKTSSV